MREEVLLKANLFLEDKTTHKIKEQFLKSCIKLDDSIFEPFIKEDEYFDSKDKYNFLKSLKYDFDSLRVKRIKETFMIKGSCLGCKFGCLTYQFYSKGKGRPAFSYAIVSNDNNLTIQKCNSSSNHNYIEIDKLLEHGII